MNRPRATAFGAAALLAVASFAASALTASSSSAAPRGEELRVATYNLSLNRNAAGQLVSDLSTPDNAQAKASASAGRHASAAGARPARPGRTRRRRTARPLGGDRARHRGADRDTAGRRPRAGRGGPGDGCDRLR